jgi:hypothetical protein
MVDGHEKPAFQIRRESFQPLGEVFLRGALVVAVLAGPVLAATTSASASASASASETRTSAGVVGLRSGTQSSSISPSITYDYTTNEYVMVYVANNSSDHILATTSTNGTTWTKSVNTGLVGASAPAITRGRDNQFIMAYVAVDDDNDLMVSTSDNGTAWTSPVWTGQESKTAPAIYSFDGSGMEFIAFVANNSSNDLVTITPDNDTTWSANSLVGGQASKTAPALSSAGVGNDPSDPFVVLLTYVANNSSNDLLATTLQIGGTTWSGSTLVGSQKSKTAPVLYDSCEDAAYTVMAYVANNSGDHLLVTTTTNGTSWSASSEVGNGQSSGLAPALADNACAATSLEYVMTYVANNSNHHLLATTSTNGTTWSASTKVKNANLGF